MSRTPAVIDDPTPLNGTRIDVAARIGWLLRTSRASRGVGVRDLAAGLTDRGLPTSAASVSRLETEGLRDGVTIGGYEQVLGIEPGRLRAVIDSVCRTFDYSPTDRRPDAETLDLAGFSDLVETVSGPQPTGCDWRRLARQHESPRGYGLTAAQMSPLVRKLCGELHRSVGSAWFVRYEALALLRCSPYADVVDAVVRELVMAPDAQVVFDLASAVAELPTPSLLAWAGDLLTHESTQLVRVGDIFVQSMRLVGGLPDHLWQTLETPLLAAFEQSSGDLERRTVLTRLFRNLPGEVRESLRPRLAGQLVAGQSPHDWSKTRRNRQLETATRLANECCAAAGLPEEPMLARLFFEALYDFRGPLVGGACYLVGASPFAEAAHQLLVEVACSTDDPELRDAARTRAPLLRCPVVQPDSLTGWLTSSDPQFVRSGYRLAGESGHLLTDGQLAAGLAGSAADQRQVLYAAGLAADPRLVTISTDERQPPVVRAAAAYWLREGGRILH